MVNYSAVIVFNQEANGFNQEEGLRLAQDALTKNPDITAFWCDSDALALGAVQAINERGLDHSKILVLGSDGEPIAFDQIRAGDGIDYTRALHGYQWGLLTAKVANSYLNSGATGYDYDSSAYRRFECGQYQKSHQRRTSIVNQVKR